LAAHRLTALTVAAALTVAGCDSRGGEAGATVVRDSSGVAIVENGAPSPAAVARRVAGEPRLQIGEPDGRPEYMLFRATSARRLGDGRILVVNSGTNELRFYDPEGRHLATRGGSGGGPGEFRALQRVWMMPGDSLLAYDFMPTRLSVHSPDGEFVRSYGISAPDGRQVIVRGLLADGSLIVEGAPVWDAEGAGDGVVRDSVPYYRYDGDGNLLGEIGRFPSAEVFRVLTAEGVRMGSLPYSRIPAKAVAGDGFYFASATDYEIDAHSAAGELRRRIRLDVSPRPVTEADVRRFQATQLEAAERGGRRAIVARMLDQMPRPETMPPYGALLLDDDRNVWVSDYRADPAEEPVWRVFSEQGEYRGEVRMPAGFEPLHIGTDFVLGRWVDELEVEYIRLFDLLEA
jgi:hypothetical protein